MANLFERVGQMGDSAGGLINNIANFNFSGFSGGLGKFNFFIKIAIYLAIVAFGSIAFYKYYIQYNIKVSLRFKTRGGSVIDVKEDRAKEIIDTNGKRKLILLKNKKLNSPPLPSLKYKYKIGKRDYYEFVVDDDGNLFPCEIAAYESVYDSEKNINTIHKTIPIPQERTAWLMNEKKLQEEKIRKKGWMDKYGAVIVPIAALACSVVIMYFAVQSINQGMSQLAGQFGQIATNCLR
jgi:hypothetical protein